MKKIFLIMIVFFIAVYFLLSKYFPDVTINKYDSFEAVQEQQAIENGWIPSNLPSSAYDIAETHDAKTQMVVGKFSYKEKDEEPFLATLKREGELYEGEEFLFKVNKEENLVNFKKK